MKERPIIFNSDEVRGIIDGRKTMMRRVIKPQPHEIAYRDRYDNEESACFWRYGEEREDWPRPKDCPYGQPGDRLWVKETTFNVEDHGYVGPVYLQSDRAAEIIDWGLAPSGDDPAEVDPEDVKLRPSIFMPKKYARIFLEVVGVRVERVQEISEEDALAEGIRRIPHGMDGDYFHFSRTEADPQNWCFPDDAFRELWDKLYAKRGYGWDANPWVWCVSFKVINKIEFKQVGG